MPIVGAIAKLAGGNPSGAASSVGGLTGAIGALAKAATGGVGAITSLASSLTGGLLAPLEPLRSMVESVGNLVGLFNPAVVQQFQLALKDTLAVVGSALVPVMQGMTIYVRAFGDALAGLLPVIQPLFDAIGQYIANNAQGLVPLLQAAAPFIQLFADALAGLINKLSLGVAFFQGMVIELLNTLASLFGLTSRYKPQSSKGFAAMEVRTGTVAQFAEAVFESSVRNLFKDQKTKTPEQAMGEVAEALNQGKQAMVNLTNAIVAAYLWAKKRFGEAEAAVEGFAEGATGSAAIANGLVHGLRALNRPSW